MARTITGTIFRRGKIYWLKYAINGQQVRKSLQTENAKDAKEKRAAIINPLALRGEVKKAKALATAAADLDTQLAATIEAVRPRLALADTWKRYESDPSRPDSGPRTLNDYRMQWAAFVRWTNKTHPGLSDMEAVTPDIAADYARSLTGLTGNTFNKRVAVCRLLFKTLAASCGNILNPFATIRPKRLVTAGRRELSDEQLRLVCRTAQGELRTLFAVGLYSALRLGDAATLRWADINFRAGVIVRAPNKTSRRHPDKLVRIPLHPVLRTILGECPTEGRKEYVMPELAASYLRDPAMLSRKVQAHLTACGITTTEQMAGRKRPAVLVGFHSLRHSFVSICANKGVPLAIVQELAGHGSPAIQRHYIHVDAGAAKNAIATLPSFDDAPPSLLAGDTAAIDAVDDARVALLARLHHLENDASLDAIRGAITALEGTP